MISTSIHPRISDTEIYLQTVSTKLSVQYLKYNHLHSYLLYKFQSLTPYSRVLLQKLTGSQLVKKFPTFYGTRRFITAFTSARHLSLSWAKSIQSITPYPTSWRSILIPSSHLRLGLPSSAVGWGYKSEGRGFDSRWCHWNFSLA